MGHALRTMVPAWLESLAFILISGVLYFGVLYSVLVTVLLILLQASPPHHYLVIACVAPLIMATAVLVQVLVFPGPREHELTAGTVLFFPTVALVVGYFYVALTLSGYWLLRRIGWVV